MKSSLIGLAAVIAMTAGCVVHDSVIAGEPLDAQFYLTWATQKWAAQGNTPVSIDCVTAGADTVRVTSRNISTGKAFIDLFDCGVKEGLTYDLTAGNYEVNVELVDCAGDVACNAPYVVSTAPSLGPIGVWRDAEIDLGHFIFIVD
jgi:hypothetical protein